MAMIIPRFSCEKWDEYKSQMPKNTKDKKEQTLIISRSSRETWYEYIRKIQRKENNKKEKTMIIPRFSCLEWEEYISEIEKYKKDKDEVKILPVSCQKWGECATQEQKTTEEKKGRTQSTRRNARKDVPKARVMPMPCMKKTEEAKIERMIAYFKDLPFLRVAQLKRYLEQAEGQSLSDKLREEFIRTAYNNKLRKKVAKEEKNFLKDNYLEEYVVKNKLSYISLRIYDIGFCFCSCTPDDPNYEKSDFVMYNKVNAMYLDILNSINSGKIPEQFFQLFKSYRNIHAIDQDLVEAQKDKHFVGQQLMKLGIKLSKLKENKTGGETNIPNLIISKKIKSLKLQSKIDKLQKELQSINYPVNFVHKFHVILKIEKFTSRDINEPFFSTFVLLKPTTSSIYSLDSYFLPIAHLAEQNHQIMMNVIESELYFEMAKNLHLKVGQDSSWNTIHLLQSYKRPFKYQTVSEALADKNKELKLYVEEEKKKEEYISLNFAHVTSTHSNISPADFWNIPKWSTFHFEDFKETLYFALTSRNINMNIVSASSKDKIMVLEDISDLRLQRSPTRFVEYNVDPELPTSVKLNLFVGDIAKDENDMNLSQIFSQWQLVEIFYIGTEKVSAKKNFTDENMHQCPVLMGADEKTLKICVYVKLGLYYIHLTGVKENVFPYKAQYLNYIGNRFQLDKYILGIVEILTHKFKEPIKIDHEKMLVSNNVLQFQKEALFHFQGSKALSNYYITDKTSDVSEKNVSFEEEDDLPDLCEVFDDIGAVLNDDAGLKKGSVMDPFGNCSKDMSDIKDIYAGPFTDNTAQNAPSNVLEDSLAQTEKGKESSLTEGNCKSDFSDISVDLELPESCSKENNATDALPSNDILSTDFVNSPMDVCMYVGEESRNAAEKANTSSAIGNNNEPPAKNENNKKFSKAAPKKEKKILYVEKIRDYGDGYTTMFEAHDHNIRLDSYEHVELRAEDFTSGLKFYDCVKDNPVPTLPADQKEFPFKFSKGELLEMKEVLEDADAHYLFRESLGLNYDKLDNDLISFWQM